jgi:hypothetical protein
MTNKKLITFIISLFCLVAATSTIGLAQNTNQTHPTRGALNYSPIDHNFGSFFDRPILNTTFEVWAGSGCCTLTYWFNWTQPYITVYPSSGTSDGEHDIITVTIDTTTLPVGFYQLPIEVNSDQGNGIFTVNFSIVLYNEPYLACTPDHIDYGLVPNGDNATAVLALQNVGTGTVDYTLAEDCPWLALDTHNGSSYGNINYVTVTASTKGLTSRIYQTTINITSNGGDIQIPISIEPTGIEIVSISAQSGKITVQMTNVGNKTIDHLHWHIQTHGLLKLFGTETSGISTGIEPGSSFLFATLEPVYGFGPLTVTVSAEYAKTTTIKGLIIFNIIILFK